MDIILDSAENMCVVYDQIVLDGSSLPLCYVKFLLITLVITL